jgi:hypothetical protein
MVRLSGAKPNPRDGLAGGIAQTNPAMGWRAASRKE